MEKKKNLQNPLHVAKGQIWGRSKLAQTKTQAPTSSSTLSHVAVEHWSTWNARRSLFGLSEDADVDLTWINAARDASESYIKKACLQTDAINCIKKKNLALFRALFLLL